MVDFLAMLIRMCANVECIEPLLTAARASDRGAFPRFGVAEQAVRN